MARFVVINAGGAKLLCNLDCSIQHFLNYVEQKCDSMGRANSQNDNHHRAESPGDHLGDSNHIDQETPSSEGITFFADLSISAQIFSLILFNS